MPGEIVGRTRFADRGWLHLEEWTSPAAISRAEVLLKACAAIEDVGYAVVEIHEVASRSPWDPPTYRGVTTASMTRAMIGLEDVRAVLHADLIALRNANRPRPRRGAPDIFQPPYRCGGVTKSGGACQRPACGIHRCWAHKDQP